MTPARLEPIVLRITWKVSGNVWYEKTMVNAHESLYSTMQFCLPVHFGGPRGMRLYLEDSDVQVFFDQSPNDMWRMYHDDDIPEGSTLHLECWRPS